MDDKLEWGASLFLLGDDTPKGTVQPVLPNMGWLQYRERDDHLSVLTSGGRADFMKRLTY